MFLLPGTLVQDRADYWVSQARKYCDFCKCWIADNKPSVQFHENGKKHKKNVELHLKEIGKKSLESQKQQTKLDADMKKMEREAAKAYLKDIEANPDYSSRLILKQKDEKLKRENPEGNQQTKSKTISEKFAGSGVYTDSSTNSRNSAPAFDTEPTVQGNKQINDQRSGTSNRKNGDNVEQTSKSKRKKKDKKKNDTNSLTTSDVKLNQPYGPSEKPDPYGGWIDVEKPKMMSISEMGLPQIDYIAVKVPQEEHKPKITFEEKTVDSLSIKTGLYNEDYNTAAGSVQFKRRKITKSSMRVRSDD